MVLTWTAKSMLWSVVVLACLVNMALAGRIPAAKLEAGVEEAKLSDILKEVLHI